MGFVREAVGIDFSDTLLNENAPRPRSLGCHSVTTKWTSIRLTSPTGLSTWWLTLRPPTTSRTFTENSVPSANGCLTMVGSSHSTRWTLSKPVPLGRVGRGVAGERRIPEYVRQEMVYPHLPTMLHDDPTEAIHSELTLENLYRCFDVEQFTPVGGAVAYPLMTHNQQLAALENASERAKWAEVIWLPIKPSWPPILM